MHATFASEISSEVFSVFTRRNQSAHGLDKWNTRNAERKFTTKIGVFRINHNFLGVLELD